MTLLTNCINNLKYTFQRNSKNLLCRLIEFLINKNLSQKFISSILNIYNSFSGKTKFNYIVNFEKTVNHYGTPEYTTLNRLCAAKPQFYYQHFTLNEIKTCNSFVVKMTSVKIIGSSNVILARSGEALYEPSIHDDNNIWDYTDTSIHKSIDSGFVLKYRDGKKSIQSGIMLSGNYSWNYYHFIYEFLTKFLLVNKLNLPTNIPIIVDEVVKTIPQYQALLSYFNTDNRELIYIKSGCSYDVVTLYYPSFLNIIPPNFKNINCIKYSDCMFDIRSITFLRDTLLPKMSKTKSNKRFFLSRRNATSRRSYNESDVVKIFEKYAFEVICPEEYGIAEQMYLFNNADFIAGVSGAAFTNTLFCSPGCKILCISSAINELSIFSTIAKHLKLDFQYLSAYEEQHKAQSLHEEFVIDPNKVENILVDFLTR